MTAISINSSSSAASSGVPEGRNYLEYYMQQAAEILIHLTQLTAQNTNTQSQIADQIINMTQAQAEEAAENAKKIAEAIEAQKNQSSFSKLFGEIFGAILILVGALTGDPILCMTGVLLLTMSASGAQEKLEEKIADLDPALQGLIHLGLAIGTALVTAGIAGGVQAVVAKVSAEAVAKAGVEAGAKAGAEAGGNAAANAGANAGTKGALSFAVSELPNAVGQSMMIFNPFIGWTEAVLEKCGVDKEKAKFIAQIIGAIMALLAAGAGSAGSTKLAESMGTSTGRAGLLSGLKAKVGEQELYISTRAVQFAGSAAGSASSAFSIMAGTTGLKTAELVKERGLIASLQVILQTILSTVQNLVDQNQSSAQTNNGVFRGMNDNWMNYLSQYDSRFMQG